MPRTGRLLLSQKCIYHVISRTALDGLPFGDFEKDEFLRIMKRFSFLYFVDVLGFSIMDNHFHILAWFLPEHEFSDEQIRERFEAFYGDSREFVPGLMAYYRNKLSSLSEYVKEIKQTFSRFYNKRYNRRGTLWGERFKSVIVEKGETLINCLAYIDLNPVRAGIVESPDDYRWCSLGYHVQTGNRDNFLSFDFGLEAFGDLNREERLRRYRRYVYEKGAVKKPGGKESGIICEAILEKERDEGFAVDQFRSFRYRTRHFTDSVIIGSKDFVHETYLHFKELFQAKREKKPNPVRGIEGLYSLKRLSEP